MVSLILLFLKYSNYNMIKINSKSLFISKKNKIIKSIRYAESPAEIVKRIGSSYTKYGEDWTITDLNKHLKIEKF